MFTRTRSSRMGSTPEPDTPYRANHQLWDRRMGTALQHAATWRTATFGAIGVIGLLGAADIMLLIRPAAVPFVIEATQTGEARLIGPATSAYEPSDAQISWHLARFVEMVRGLPADPIVVRQNWLRAYDFTTQAGGVALTAMAKADDPFSKIGKSTVAVEVLSVVRASPTSFQVRWRETTYQSGTLIHADRFTGVITTVIAQSSTPERLQKNPLGLYVHAFTWSRDLQQ